MSSMSSDFDFSKFPQSFSFDLDYIHGQESQAIFFSVELALFIFLLFLSM